MSSPRYSRIRERLILKDRLDVGELPTVGGALGALLGTSFLADPAIAVGAIGKRLAQWLGEADYAAYSEKARELWARSRADVKRVLETQFGARASFLADPLVGVGEIGKRLARWLGEADRYVAAYSEKARELWVSSTADVKTPLSRNIRIDDSQLYAFLGFLVIPC